MKMFLGVAVAATLSFAGAAGAEDFNFSFMGDNGYPGTVTGTIYGLASSGESAPTSVTASFQGGQTLTFIPGQNGQSQAGSFTVTNGEISNFSFRDQEFSAISDLFAQLDLNFGGDSRLQYAQLFDSEVVQNTGNPLAVGFTPGSDVSAAPEPGAWALMMLGVGAIGAMLGFRKRVLVDYKAKLAAIG